MKQTVERRRSRVSLLEVAVALSMLLFAYLPSLPVHHITATLSPRWTRAYYEAQAYKTIHNHLNRCRGLADRRCLRRSFALAGSWAVQQHIFEHLTHQLGQSLHATAALHGHLRQFSYAEPRYKQAIELHCFVTKDRFALRDAVECLAEIYERLERPELAQQLLAALGDEPTETSFNLESFKRRYVALEPQIARTEWTDLGMELTTRSNGFEYKKALWLNHRALRMRSEALGQSHPLVADTNRLLGDLYRTSRISHRYTSYTYYSSALEGHLASYGPTHLCVAQDHHRIAHYYMDTKPDDRYRGVEQARNAQYHFVQELDIRFLLLSQEQKSKTTATAGWQEFRDSLAQLIVTIAFPRQEFTTASTETPQQLVDLYRRVRNSIYVRHPDREKWLAGAKAPPGLNPDDESHR